MQSQLFTITCLVLWCTASNASETIDLCDQFVNAMNKSDSSLNCQWNDEDWEFETTNILVKLTPNEMLDIHCRQHDDAVQNELNFFNFSTFEYHILILNECTNVRGLNPDIDHLEVLHIKKFDLQKFPNLKELEMVNSTQFQNLNQLSRLEKLTIHQMYLSNLTVNLDKLKTFTLKSNYIVDDLNGVQLSNLKYLSLLSNRNLRLVNFEKFPNLVKLEIRSQYAPNETYNINQMRLNTKLEILEVSYFELTEIWNEELVSGRKELRIIRLNDNRIEQIRNNRIFTDLPKLEELNMYGNRLRNLDFLAKTNLPRLRILNLGKNNIKVLYKGLSSLPALEHLYLNNNGLVTIHDTVFTSKNPNLRFIDLQDNRLAFLSNSNNNPFERVASSLETLNLKSNRLQDFNELYVSKFHHLSNLDVSFNHIKTIRGSELEFKHEISVNFESNNISEIVFLPGRNYSLVRLNFNNNHDFNHFDCANYEFIKYFSFNRALVNFPALNNINLSHYYCFEKSNENMCSSDQCSCKKYPYIKTYYIYCGNKKLTKLPDVLPNFPDSTFTVNLDLDNNDFAAYTNFKLPPDYYTKITRLSLRNCSLNNFNAFARHNSTITVLNLDDNHIANFRPEIVKNFTNLLNLTLANNRFECNCDTGYLYNFVNEKKFYNLDFLTCANRNSTDFLYNQKYIVCPLIHTAVLATLIATLILVIIISTVTIVKLKFALELKLLMFVFKSHYFHTSTAVKYPYDVFLSYSDDDTNFVEKNILSKLESETKSPRNHIVTINRNSTMDKMIHEQIVHFVDNSKFIVIVLSANFLNSDWNRFTFRTAYCNAFQNNRYPVIVILKDNIKDLNAIDPTLKSYLTTRTYIPYNSRFFWTRINYILSK